jgi:hypothetical protein
MHLSLGLLSARTEDVTLSPRPSPQIQYEESDQTVDLWYIKSHDRQALVDRIMPSMARSLHKKDLLCNFMERRSWAGELVKSELTGTNADDDSACFRQTTAAFWTDPTSLALDLLQLTRLWFFLLLRSTYRRHFFEGRESSRGVLDVRDFCTFQHVYLFSELSEDAIHRLSCVRNRYGASFYRSSYKDTKRRLGWTSFCERIRAFCESVGLHTSSKHPEKNLWDLRHNLTSIMMHQKWLYIINPLIKEVVLARNMRVDVKKLNERMASGAMHNVQMMENMERGIMDLKSQFEDLKQEPQQIDMKISTKLKKFRVANEKKLKELDCDIRHTDETSRQLIESLGREIKELRIGLGCTDTRKEERMTAEVLILCRWLLEHLPATNSGQQRLGHHWRQFWKHHWDQCKINRERKSHPLWELASDEKYNKVGRNLYGTLSERLHGYGYQLGDSLHPDVQRVVDVIRPIHYDDGGKVDLYAERMRWLG